MLGGGGGGGNNYDDDDDGETKRTPQALADNLKTARKSLIHNSSSRCCCCCLVASATFRCPVARATGGRRLVGKLSAVDVFASAFLVAFQLASFRCWSVRRASWLAEKEEERRSEGKRTERQKEKKRKEKRSKKRKKDSFLFLLRRGQRQLKLTFTPSTPPLLLLLPLSTATDAKSIIHWRRRRFAA